MSVTSCDQGHAGVIKDPEMQVIRVPSQVCLSERQKVTHGREGEVRMEAEGE